MVIRQGQELCHSLEWTEFLKRHMGCRITYEMISDWPWGKIRPEKTTLLWAVRFAFRRRNWEDQPFQMHSVQWCHQWDWWNQEQCQVLPCLEWPSDVSRSSWLFLSKGSWLLAGVEICYGHVHSCEWGVWPCSFFSWRRRNLSHLDSFWVSGSAALFTMIASSISAVTNGFFWS